MFSSILSARNLAIYMVFNSPKCQRSLIKGEAPYQNGNAGDGTATFVFVNLDLSCPAQEWSVSCIFISRCVRSLRTGAESECGHGQGHGRKRGIRAGDGADLYPKQLAKLRGRVTEKVHFEGHGIASDGTVKGDKVAYSNYSVAAVFNERPLRSGDARESSSYGRSTGRGQMSAPATTRGEVQASGDQFRRILRQ